MWEPNSASWSLINVFVFLQEDDLYRTLKQNKLLAMHIVILHQSRVHVETSSFSQFFSVELSIYILNFMFL